MKLAKLESGEVREREDCDHEDARRTAALRFPNNNLARCYLDLLDRLEEMERRMGTPTSSFPSNQPTGDQRVAGPNQKVWVIYDTSDYEGCSQPLAAYSSEEAAKAMLQKIDSEMPEIIELEVDGPPPASYCKDEVTAQKAATDPNLS